MAATQQYFHQEPGAKAADKCSQYLFSSPDRTPLTDCDHSVLGSLYALPLDLSPNRVSTLIATVYDPLHTRMSVETDRYLDAVQQAAYRSGWEMATQWLPWTFKASQDSASSSLHLGSKEVDVEELPGLLLFRRHFIPKTQKSVGTDPSDILMIFIVGETPTAGINGYQFEVARNSITRLGS